jgi:anaerobic magnesium-protoporphyrin IX monomethyl ester cyclase
VLKVMFIDAIDYEATKETFLPTLGLGYLASSLRKELGYNNVQIKIVRGGIEQQIDKFRPDIIGITSLSNRYNRAMRCAKIAKEYGLPVIIGGMHISVLPANLTSDMDVGVIGEGEETILELVKLFREKGNFDRNELENIDGVVFNRDNKLIVTNKRKLMEPLDSLPMPARDLFEINKECTYMFTSRGCPYGCTYCSSSRFWGKVRFFSAEYVVNEIEYLIKEYKVQHILLMDDLFVASKARVRQILDLLEEKDILGKVSFEMQTTSNLVDDELARLLKKMNVRNVSIGFESGCPTILEYLKAGRISIDDHLNAVKILRNHGLQVSGSFIIGSPKETREDFLQTLSFVKKNRLSGMLLLLTPFPGTPVWDYAKERGLVSDYMDWNCLDLSFDLGKDKAIILSEVLTRDEIYELFLTWRKEQLKMATIRELKLVLRRPLRIRNLLIYLRAIWSLFKTRMLSR